MSDHSASTRLQGQISRLFIYPIKSCAGIEVKESLLIETGLEFDRAWMVVDAQGEFISQRDLPRMALISVKLRQYDLVLKAPGMLALHIALDAVEQPCRVRVWDDEVAAYDMGDVAAQWFSDFLNQELPVGASAQKLRLVRFDPEQKRLSSKEWTKELDAENQFSDGYPILVLSQASLNELNQRLTKAGQAPVGIERFRPNIVIDGLEAHDEDRTPELHISTEEGTVELRLVKPCPRCPMPNIDPHTAISSPEVSDMLRQYRQDARVDGAITFGMNAVMVQGIEQALRVGQSVQGQFSF